MTLKLSMVLEAAWACKISASECSGYELS